MIYFTTLDDGSVIAHRKGSRFGHKKASSEELAQMLDFIGGGSRDRTYDLLIRVKSKQHCNQQDKRLSFPQLLRDDSLKRQQWRGMFLGCGNDNLRDLFLCHYQDDRCIATL
jgi:hypothetical protein